MLVAAVVMGSAHTFIAAPAEAASFVATDEASLIAAIDDANAAPGADIITIGADITGVRLLVAVSDELTIDVGGFTVDNVRLRATASLTLNGPGRWNATAVVGAPLSVDESAAPGLGISAGHTLTISKLRVEASGTFCDAGIGGWNESRVGTCSARSAVASGTVTIIDSTIVAKGGSFVSGIGGSAYLGGSAITLVRSAVIATGGSADLSGIGVGYTGGNIDVDDYLDATLSLTSSTLIDTVVSAHTTVNPGVTALRGAVEFAFPVSNQGTIEVAGTMSGDGIVTNQGTIRPASNVLAMDVQQNSFEVIADSALPAATPPTRFTVYAPTMADANEVLPTPTRVLHHFVEWNTAADGSGTTVTDSTMLAPLADSDGEVEVYAVWALALVLTPTTPTAMAGDTLAFTLTADGIDVTASATFTSSNLGDTVVANTVTVTASGVRTITAEYVGFTVQETMTVDAAAPVSLSVTSSAIAVNQGDTITLTLDGLDTYGNPVTIDPATVILTSSVSTDVINGLTVHFPTASPHTVTATVGALSASTTIQVSPAALLPALTATLNASTTTQASPAAFDGSLASTGSGSMLASLIVALLVIVVGVVTVIVVRRRSGATVRYAAHGECTQLDRDVCLRKSAARERQNAL